MAAASARDPVGLRRAALAAAAAVLLAAVTGCAKEEAPPGALPDQRPPGIREIVPARGSVVKDLDDPLKVRFDEPIERPGSGYGRQMEASPAYRYRVTSSFTEIQVRPEEGWRPGAVYVFRLPGGIRDLLGNAREEPIDVVFSTGPEVTETRVSGRIRDGVTGRGVRDARVLFLSEEGDSIPYTAVSDTGGVYSLASLPPGRYTAYGFQDLNGDLSLDRRLEPHDSARVRLEDASASAEVTFRMIPPDSTPPVLARAEAVDSLTVLLVFDDPLDPGQDFGAAKVAVRASGEAGELPVERVGLTRPAEPPAPVDTAGPGAAGDMAAAEDAVAGDTIAAADTAAAEDAVAGDTVAAADAVAGPEPGEAAAAVADTLPLPSDSLFLRLGRTLEAERTYRASASGLVNLRGLAGGGDTTFVYTPTDTATAGARGAAGDTAAAGEPAPRDTATEGAPPDTADGDGRDAAADTAGAEGVRPRGRRPA